MLQWCAFFLPSNISTTHHHHYHHHNHHHALHHCSTLAPFLSRISFMLWAILKWYPQKNNTGFKSVAQLLPLCPTLAFQLPLKRASIFIPCAWKQKILTQFSTSCGFFVYLCIYLLNKHTYTHTQVWRVCCILGKTWRTSQPSKLF